MFRKTFIVYLTASLLCLSASNAQDVVQSKPSMEVVSKIVINTNTVLASGVSTKMGININAGWDNDKNRKVDARTLVEALKEIGVHHLRFPGGEKTNSYVWASVPYNSPTTQYWLPESLYEKEAKNTLNFDEFMNICHQLGAEPHINVAYNPAAGCDEKLAAAWVKYANVTKKYGIKYWEIGNEMWHDNKNKLTAEQLTTIAKSYTSAMKAVDSTIKIGMSGKLSDASMLDFYTISNYAGYGGSYNAYITGDKIKLSFIENSDKPIVVSEYNAATWSKEDKDDDKNDAMHGLINFDITGQLLMSSNCAYACFWNTRWFNGVGKSKWDALDSMNYLSPIARPMRLWGVFCHDQFVQNLNSNSSIVVYASLSSTTNGLTLYFINKASSSQKIDVAINSLQNYSRPTQVWCYKGADPYDTNPSCELSETPIVPIDNKILNFELPGTSIIAMILRTTN